MSTRLLDARRSRDRAALVLLMAATACSSTGEHASPPPRKDAAPVPSFARDIAPVLAKHCTGKECHGDEPADDVKLDLRPGLAYRQLVNVRAEMGELPLMRIQPGDSDASLLVHKLTGRTGRKEGKKMPIDDVTGEPIVPDPLPFGFVDGVLVPWILAGAPDN